MPHVQLVGYSKNVQIFEVKLLGANAHTGRKLSITVVFVSFIRPRLGAGQIDAHGRERDSGGRRILDRVGSEPHHMRSRAARVRLDLVRQSCEAGNGEGLVGAGVAFALRKVITISAGTW
jgi:hypothetical protein